MSDLHGQAGGSASGSRRGRRVRPGAVPDARPDGEVPAEPVEPAFDELVAPQPVRYDRDDVFDVEAAPPRAATPAADPSVEPEPYLEPESYADAEPEPYAEHEETAYPAAGYPATEVVEEEYLEDPEYQDPEYQDPEYQDHEYQDPEYEDLEDGHEVEHEEYVPAGRRRGGGRGGRRRGRTVVALVICLALLGGAVYAGWSFLSPIVDRITSGDPPAEDYPGPGSGEVDVVVAPGDTGGAIGDTLLEAGVVASRAAFVAEFTVTPAAATLQPGTYRLRKEMKASDALALLLDPASRQSLRVGIREGLWVSEVLPEISADTGFTVEELQAALADPAVGLPPEAEGDAEGFLFPATYDFEPGITPVEILAAMVARYTQAMDDLGVPADQRRDVLIRASIVQGEASREEDLAKVARVIENRIDAGDTLGMDSTVGYVVQKRALDLTQSDLETDSPYNTRLNPGLPPGPINNPGEAAIAAAMAPAEGDWLYFVTVDGDTGETVFTADYDEFLAAKRQFQEWLADNG